MVRNMKRIKTLVFLTVIIFGFAGQLLPVEAADFMPVLKVSTDDVYLTAGQENTIKITLQNVGSWNLYEGNIALTVPVTTPGISIVDGSHYVFNKLSDGASVAFYPVLYVDEDTPLGAYSLTFQATYMKKVQYSASMLEATTLQIGIVVDKALKSKNRLSAEADSPLLTAGIVNELGISLTNLGEATINDIDATVSSTSPYIVILEGGRFTHGSLQANQSAVHLSSVIVSQNAPIGVYTLTEMAVYEDENGEQHVETFVVGVNVHNVSKPNPMFDIVIGDPHLIAGAENSIEFTLMNIGDEGLMDIDVSLTSTSPYLAVLEGARIVQSGIDTDESVSHESIIGVSRYAPLGVYILTATASYRGEDGQDYLEVTNLGVSVDSIDVPEQTTVVLDGYETSIEPIRPGDEFDFNLILECLGADAHNVMATLSLDPLTGISTMSPTTVSVGDLETDQSGQASFELLVGGGVWAGQYPAMATVSYLDADGVPMSLMETVTLSVRSLVEFKLINADTVTAEIEDSTEVEGDLLLVGTESVQFVSVQVVEDSVFGVTTGSEEYIGAVDPDSPIPFDVMFTVAEGTETGEHSLILRIVYTDDLNDEHTETVELTVDVVEASFEADMQTSSTGGFWAWLRRLLGLGP